MVKYFWKALLWGVIIITGSLLSGPNLPKISLSLFSHMDKVIHFFMYLVLTLFIISGYHKMPPKNSIHLRQKLYGLAITIIFGGLMEVFQMILTTVRTGDMYDFIANLSGSLIGVIFFNTASRLSFGIL